MIDIGGPSLMRASAKNFYDITTICDPKYYESFIQDLNNNNGNTSLSFRKKMSQKVFKQTSYYDIGDKINLKIPNESAIIISSK